METPSNSSNPKAIAGLVPVSLWMFLMDMLVKLCLRREGCSAALALERVGPSVSHAMFHELCLRTEGYSTRFTLIQTQSSRPQNTRLSICRFS